MPCPVKRWNLQKRSSRRRLHSLSSARKLVGLPPNVCMFQFCLRLAVNRDFRGHANASASRPGCHCTPCGFARLHTEMSAGSGSSSGVGFSKAVVARTGLDSKKEKDAKFAAKNSSRCFLID